MFETVKQFDEETVTKENNISLTRELTASILSVNVDYLDEIKNKLMIEGDVTKSKKSIGQLKYDSVFLLNDVEITLHNK